MDVSETRAWRKLFCLRNIFLKIIISQSISATGLNFDFDL